MPGLMSYQQAAGTVYSRGQQNQIAFLNTPHPEEKYLITCADCHEEEHSENHQVILEWLPNHMGHKTCLVYLGKPEFMING